MSLPLRQLEAFHAIVVTGNATKAAVMLKISQPAVSRLVGSLEQNLGFKLFERRSGRLRPTPEARALFDDVERALANLKHISRLTQDIQAKKSGHIRIACLPGFARSLLPRVLARFLNERPGITLTLEPRDPEKIVEWVSAQQYDLGITDQMADNPALENETFLIRTVCILPLGHPLADRQKITPRDLHEIPLIHKDRTHFVFAALKQAFADAGATLKSLVETLQFAPACIMVAEGCGVSVVSEIDAREYEKEGLVIKPFEPSIPFEINVLYPAYMPRSIITREFVEEFKKSLAPFRLRTPS